MIRKRPRAASPTWRRAGPAHWNTAPQEEVFAPEPDEALRARYRRWLDMMQEATGVRYL